MNSVTRLTTSTRESKWKRTNTVHTELYPLACECYVSARTCADVSDGRIPFVFLCAEIIVQHGFGSTLSNLIRQRVDFANGTMSTRQHWRFINDNRIYGLFGKLIYFTFDCATAWYPNPTNCSHSCAYLFALHVVQDTFVISWLSNLVIVFCFFHSHTPLLSPPLSLSPSFHVSFILSVVDNKFWP